MNSCRQASLCLIGIFFMHNSECGIEPLAWGRCSICRNIFSCSFLSWCIQLCLRWWAAVYVWRWETQICRESVILEKYEFCPGYCMLSRKSKYNSTAHKSSFLLQKHKNKNALQKSDRIPHGLCLIMRKEFYSKGNCCNT